MSVLSAISSSRSKWLYWDVQLNYFVDHCTPHPTISVQSAFAIPSLCRGAAYANYLTAVVCALTCMGHCV